MSRHVWKTVGITEGANKPHALQQRLDSNGFPTNDHRLVPVTSLNGVTSHD